MCYYNNAPKTLRPTHKTRNVVFKLLSGFLCTKNPHFLKATLRTHSSCRPQITRFQRVTFLEEQHNLLSSANSSLHFSVFQQRLMFKNQGCSHAPQPYTRSPTKSSVFCISRKGKTRCDFKSFHTFFHILYKLQDTLTQFFILT